MWRRGDAATATATVQIGLGGQTIQHIPLETVGLVVLIAQLLQAPIGVIAESYFMTERVNALLDPPAGVVVVLGAQVGRIDVVSELAGQVALIAVDTPVGAFALDQVAAQVVTVLSGLASVNRLPTLRFTATLRPNGKSWRQGDLIYWMRRKYSHALKLVCNVYIRYMAPDLSLGDFRCHV